MNQLKIKDRYEEVYIDLVNDYMSLWELKNELIRDLKERGAQIEVINSKGFKQLKKNDSSDSLLKCNAQMLKLLTELGLSASEVIANRDDDEDDI
ncbi:P27 family phage terminase small subunit [Turicibacter sanguinis]|uniref:P27 family phage terminase small subunit n=1 Tax=Turicibacter sanguinis TaxID=154288 RepID=UPI00399A329B